MGQIGKFASQIGGQLLNQGIGQLFNGIQNGTFGAPAALDNTASNGAFSNQQITAAVETQSAILINKNSNNDPLPVIYGEKRIGGVRIYANTSNNAGDLAGTSHFIQVLALCEGEMTGIKKVYFDDELVWDGAGSGTYTDNGDYWTLDTFEGEDTGVSVPNIEGKLVHINFHKGVDNASVDPDLQTAIGNGVWTTDHKLQGICYVSMILESNPKYYESSVPTVTFVVQGKKIYNVATLAADPGNPGAALYTPTVDVNPVDVLYDYLTNTRYGKGLDHNTGGVFTPGQDIDFTSWSTQRTYANNRFKINGMVNTGAKIFDNVEMITAASNAFLIYSNGKYRLKIPKDNESDEQEREMIIEEREMLSAFTVNYAGKKDVLNTVHVSFSDPTADYNDEIAIIQDATALAEDNNQTHDVKIDQPLITDRTLIENFAQYKIDRSRLAKLYSFELPHSYITLEVGDIAKLQHRYLSSSGQPIRILSLTLTADDKIQVVAEPDLTWLTDYFPQT